MRKILGLLLILALPAWADDAPSGCGMLCGNWVLDAAHSDALEPVVDAALVKYKEPKAPRIHRPYYDDRDLVKYDPLEAVESQFQDPNLDFEPQTKEQMRAALLVTLAAPPTLLFSAQGDDVLMRTGEHFERRFFPGEPHSRVDSHGTAKINTDWRKNVLFVSESYKGKGKREGTETYALQSDGSLLVTRTLERSGVALMRVRYVYRRG
ncbi:MAG: hypothetical protein WDO12_10545 [Pseudomonadota bacterium]